MAVSEQNGFLFLPNFKCPFLKNDDRYQSLGQPLFGTLPLLHISKLSFPEAPKTLIEGSNVRDIFWETGFLLLQWTNVNFDTSCNPIQLKLCTLKDLIHNFDLSPQPSELVKLLKSIELWVSEKIRKQIPPWNKTL